MDIVKHSSCNLLIGAPSDMQDGSCSVLPVHQHQDQNGVWSISFWKPSPEELALLNEGGTIALWVRASGRQHPVVGLETIKGEKDFTFEQFVQHGRDQLVPLYNNMPWSFNFYGCPVTHENDEKYFITTPQGQSEVTPKHWLLVTSDEQVLVLEVE